MSDDISNFYDDSDRADAHATLEFPGNHAARSGAEEPFEWVSEPTVAPWTIYVLEKAE